MSKCILVLKILLLLVSVKSQRPPPSPCPNLYHYESDGYRVYGVITASNPPPYGSSMSLRIKMSLAAQLSTSYVGKIELYEDRDTVLRQIMQNLPVRYKVLFPLASPLPYIVNIIFNNRLICSGPVATGNFITSIDLEHTLRSGKAVLDSVPKDDYDVPIPVARNPDYGYDYNVDTRVATPSSEGPCGVVNGNTMPLIVGGDTPEKGEWPWLVAVYRKKHGNLEFICGGTLISQRHVLTAAHCVTNNDRSTVPPKDVVLRMGVYNMDDWSDETAITKTVSQIRIRDYFEGYLYSNDIAILLTKSSVNFNDYVKPACLWNGDSNQNQIVGKNGVVVGWGKDETGATITSEPKVLSVPIVSTTTCRGSNPSFFHLTSNTTICAGSKQGTGPCTGDSGGGLYMKQGDRWAIRGIVSNALKDDNNSCNLNEYVIYTDAAKYISWIRQIQQLQ